jgi:hypothetical protein
MIVDQVQPCVVQCKKRNRPKRCAISKGPVFLKNYTSPPRRKLSGEGINQPSKAGDAVDFQRYHLIKRESTIQEFNLEIVLMNAFSIKHVIGDGGLIYPRAWQRLTKNMDSGERLLFQCILVFCYRRRELIKGYSCLDAMPFIEKSDRALAESILDRYFHKVGSVLSPKGREFWRYRQYLRNEPETTGEDS